VTPPPREQTSYCRSSCASFIRWSSSSRRAIFLTACRANFAVRGRRCRCSGNGGRTMICIAIETPANDAAVQVTLYRNRREQAMLVRTLEGDLHADVESRPPRQQKKFDHSGVSAVRPQVAVISAGEDSNPVWAPKPGTAGTATAPGHECWSGRNRTVMARYTSDGMETNGNFVSFVWSATI